MEQQDQILTMKELICKASQVISERGHSAVSSYFYNRIWRHLLKYASEKDIDYFSMDFGMEYLKAVENIQCHNKLSKFEKQKLRAVKLLHDIQQGNQPVKYYPVESIKIPQQYHKTFTDYQSYLAKKGQKKNTVKGKASRIKVFFEFLDSSGVKSLEILDFQNITAFFTFLNGKYAPVTRSNIQFTLRDFLRYAEDQQIVRPGFSAYIQTIYSNKDERLPSTYSQEEISRIILSVDRTTVIGKRDYAVLLMAIRLGIRSSDIRHLTIQGIHWNENLIEFCQQKTGIYQKLPLTDEIKYALADYLKNSRPNANGDTIFVRTKAPYEALSIGNSLYYILNKYMKKACIITEGKRHGMHSMRHSLSSNLLSEGTPLPVITGILGHSSSEVTKRYLWMDLEKMRLAALEVPHGDA
jgi:site-specific recombinase XerD